MAEKFSLKDALFNKTKVEKIAKELKLAYSEFKDKEFVYNVVKEFPNLELKARITWIAECLKNNLPDDYKTATKVLIKSLPSPNNPELSDNDFGDFIYAPYAEFVAKNGCTKEYLNLSLNALYEITKRFSAEDAIRYFINSFPKETLNQLLEWSKDANYHVRRLCSEGTRPKLPWAQKINIPITEPLKILDNLFSDKTRFVTRSVANHINDISKLNPKLVIEILTKWKNSNQQDKKEMDYIIRHSLRTLVKLGDSEAIEMLGFSPDIKLQVIEFNVPEKVKMNTALNFSFSIISEKDSNVVIDYIIYFQNKLGKINSKKIFKLKNVLLKKGEKTIISKNHMLRQFMTTRTLYKGKHMIELQINGKLFGKKEFLLE